MPSKSNPEQHTAGRFAYEGLERVIHEKARLGILTSLMTRSTGLSFNDLKELCGLTDGNLNRHLDVLVDAKLIEVRKDQKQRRTCTTCHITPLGRARFLEYLAELERVIADAASVAKKAGKSPANALRLSTT